MKNIKRPLTIDNYSFLITAVCNKIFKHITA